MPRDIAEKYVERMGGALTDAGLQRLPSRVFAALTVDEDGRMTAAELASTLGVSPAAISGAVAYLTQVSFIHREQERGSRRHVYVVDADAWHSAMSRRDRIYGPMVTALEEAIAGLAEGSEPWRRLVLMREFLVFMTDEMARSGERWQARRRQLERELPRDG